MIVSNFPDFSNSKKRVVFMEKNGIYLAWGYADTLEKAKDITETGAWLCAKDIEEEPKGLELTLEQIAEKFNVPVDKIKIKK